MQRISLKEKMDALANWFLFDVVPVVFCLLMIFAIVAGIYTLAGSLK